MTSIEKPLGPAGGGKKINMNFLSIQWKYMGARKKTKYVP
jgi:hypothetical protein